MDYVDWCSYVLQTCIQAQQTTEQVRLSGITPFELTTIITTALGTEDYGKRPDFTDSTFYRGLVFALNDLLDYGLVEKQLLSHYWKVTKYGREIAGNLTPVWWDICTDTLEPEHEQLLGVVNRLSMHSTPDHVWLEEISREALLAETGWDADSPRLFRVAHELQELRYVDGSFMTPRHFTVQANYKGLVWETRRGLTVETQFINELLSEGETTSVEFKRELHLGTSDQKAEFIKDVLALANTRASGRHWLVVGFDDKTHTYFQAPNPVVTEHRIESLLARYTTPCVDIRYEVVQHQAGPVGMLEVLRDAKKVPYRVAKAIRGEKKAVSEGAIYVRHNTLVEPPTPPEEQALQEEGDRARNL
ncbi:MAG TPA: ATP-binding protein [Ktedonobacterales bacterium]|nr:ATP-binding protein [Ktedonobacterales bacterium]